MNALALNSVKKYSIAEYLQKESTSKERHEYQNGWIINMAGGSYNHSKIIGNTMGQLNRLLETSNCAEFDSNLKVYIDSSNAFVYPDTMVICGQPEFYENRKDIITNPMLIIEVLSPSTASYDRSEKFIQYRSLPSFKEYVLIASDRPLVETFYREDDTYWRISSAIGLESNIHLYSINHTIPLKAIYRKTIDLQNVQTRLDL